jgi:uncharacterized protein (TIGR00251 family)
LAYLTETPEGLRLAVYVQPRARKSALAGLHGDAVKIALDAPPVDGKANAALRRFLADLFHVSLSSVTILRGETGRNKLLQIASSDWQSVHQILSASGINPPATSHP